VTYIEGGVSQIRKSELEKKSESDKKNELGREAK